MKVGTNSNGTDSKLFYGIVRGFARFVNIRDGNGATPLHLAARQSGMNVFIPY